MADITGLGSIADFAGSIVDKIWPSSEDKAKRDEAKAKLLEAQQKGDLAEMEHVWDNAAQQVEVNKTEAASDNVFVSGWRPFLGWCCGGAFAYNYIAAPLVVTIGQIWVPDMSVPQLDMSQMMPVLAGMLGLGYLRSNEKRKGVATWKTGG